MGVYGRPVGRKDVRLVRGDGNCLGGRWRQRSLKDGSIRTVDLSAWSGRVQLYPPVGSEPWYSQPCGEMTSDGYAVADIPPSAFTGPVWSQRRSGRWKCVVESPDGGTVRTLAWGYWALND
ncbi:hypothetical protein OZX73_05310 [Bifidobacterium sp. ESL0775]|uniref:hypothetical protein n=1 Tax=Bifidobacterium sp. ESL0775 TaxID=2983230 RepID=UPI0023F799D4|nr:hypothetical protein [Bifidobacterium sp. ESL0775]WEV68710.1 hypothetical protein OZX73_05310 [Bifidobacterium sp. ESL0775]